MSIRVTCDECGESFSTEDKHRGKRIRCEECGEFVAVPHGDEKSEPRRKSEPRSNDKPERQRKSRRRDDDRDRPARKRGLSPALIAGLIAVAIGAVGITVWQVTKKKAPPQDNTPEQAFVEGPGTQPTQALPKNDGNPAKDPPRTKDRERPKGPPQPPQPKTDIEWKVEPDPLAEALESPTGPGTINITGFSGQVVYPSIPSTFVCLAQKGPRGDVREVWNLHSMKKVGTVDAGAAGDRPVLSPEGSMLAVQDPPVPTPGISIWSVPDGKQIAKFPLLDRSARLSDMDFIGPNEFLTAMRSGQDHIYQVWDIKTGKELRRFKPEGSTERNGRALSAGRKYLAMFSKKEDRIAIYDLGTGELAGEALMPQQILGGFEGLSFSADGKNLVALYRFMGNGRLNVWDLETGKLTYDHKFGSGLKGIPLNGHPIEWLDDGSGWFIHASLLVESKSAAQFWKIPEVLGDQIPRRVFGTEYVARGVGDKQNLKLKLEKLPADQVAAALKAAQPADGEGGRPALTKPDWTTAKKVAPPDANAAWKAAADPGPSPKETLGVRPIPLRGQAGDLSRISFSSPQAGIAAVLSTPLQNELGTKRNIVLDRYDVAAGKHLGTTELFPFEPPPKGVRIPQLQGTLSPEGSLFALIGPKGKRLDIWSVADGKFSVAFSPLDRGSPNVISWAAFVDEKRLLTLSGPRLALWDVPSCKVVWFVTSVSGPPALSPGHKYIAVCSGSSFDLLEVASGQRVGTLGGPAVRGVGSAGFRPDGKQIAALVSTADGKNTLTRWDATTGKVMSSCPATVLPGEVVWPDDNHVLVGTVLFDLQLGWPVAMYNVGFGRHAIGSPDGRCWFALAPDNSKPARLTAQTVPDTATKELMEGVADKTVQVALAPGMAVTVQIQNGPPNDQDASRRSLDAVTKNLQSRGFVVAAGSPLNLSVGYQGPRATGETQEYETVGLQKMTIRVAMQAVDGVATLRDGQGVIYEQKAVYKMGSINIVQTDDIQGLLTKGMWESAAGFPSSVGIPNVILRAPGGIQILPRPVLLTGNGKTK